jgi:hypothetical protein
MQVILNEQVAERKFGVIEIEMSQGIAKYQWELSRTTEDFEFDYTLVSDPMPDEDITEAEATEIDTLIRDTVIWPNRLVKPRT